MAREDKHSKKDKGEEQGTGSGFGGILPFLLIAALLIAVAVQQLGGIRREKSQQREQLGQQQQEKQELLSLHEEMVEEEARLREEVREANIAMGLDPEYPSFKFPIYEGMEILETRREETMSTLGEEMDSWYIKGQVDAELDDIQRFYRDRLQEEGLRQTQYISIPGGYAFNYANEWYDTRFAIEQQSGDPLPRVEITIYRVRDDSVKIGE